MKDKMSFRERIIAAQAKHIELPHFVGVDPRAVQSEYNLMAVLRYLDDTLTKVIDFWMPKPVTVTTKDVSRTKAKKLKKKAAQENLYANALVKKQEEGLLRSKQLVESMLMKVGRPINSLAKQALKRYLKEQMESFIVGKTSTETGKKIKSLRDFPRNVETPAETLPQEVTVHSRMIFLTLNVMIDKFENTLLRLDLMGDLADLYESIIDYDSVLREILL